jgi:secreted trypsin-like serine protease
LWKAGQANLASATFLGGRWAVTAAHAARGTGFLVTLPVLSLADIRPPNTFHVAGVIPAPGGADLALLRLSEGNLPGIVPATLASPCEAKQAESFLLCGFGSPDPLNPALTGTKRLAQLADASAGDSGGGVYIAGTRKLVALMSGFTRQRGRKPVPLTIPLAPLRNWLRETTNLAL